MLWSAQEISKKFRNALGKNISPRAIHAFATKLGYHMKHIGGKRGYDQSLYTALTRHLKELLNYDTQLTARMQQRPQKQQNLGDYYTYNGERDNIDYEWEKNENRKIKRININESQLHLINEINHLAEKSNVTICNLEDFKSLVSSLGINDGNVEQYAGQYCFIEIGSSFPRVYNEKNFAVLGYNENGEEYSPKEFYKFGQWYFKGEHSNVIKLEFDDNQDFDKTTANANGKDFTWIPNYDKERYNTDRNYKKLVDSKLKQRRLGLKNIPATAVNIVHHRWYDPSKSKKENTKTFYYTHGKGVDDEMINRLKNFVDDNLALNPNVKFVLHCRAGQSRSAAVGVYLAKKVGQYTDDFLSEYADQIKMPTMKDNGKRSTRYPHQNMLNGLSRAEGWQDLTGKRQATKAAERWWYPQMMNYLEKNGK